MVNPLVTDPVTLALHELRAPLGLVATAARSAAEDCDDEHLRGRCEMIVRAAERMLRTAQEVLSLARSTESATGAEFFNPAEVARAVAMDLAGMGVGVRLMAEWDAEPAFFGVRGHFETLISSIVSNALDHGETGSGVNVTVLAEPETVRVLISNERRKTGGRHQGLGLGTYICDQLAAQLPARIERASDGDAFVVTVTLDLAASWGLGDSIPA